MLATGVRLILLAAARLVVVATKPTTSTNATALSVCRHRWGLAILSRLLRCAVATAGSTCLVSLLTVSLISPRLLIAALRLMSGLAAALGLVVARVVLRGVV